LREEEDHGDALLGNDRRERRIKDSLSLYLTRSCDLSEGGLEKEIGLKRTIRETQRGHKRGTGEKKRSGHSSLSVIFPQRTAFVNLRAGKTGGAVSSCYKTGERRETLGVVEEETTEFHKRIFREWCPLTRGVLYVGKSKTPGGDHFFGHGKDGSS